MYYTEAECIEMVETGIISHDAPLWVHKEVDKRRRRLNRKALSPEKEMHQFLKDQYEAKPWLTEKKNQFESWFRKVLIGNRQSKFISLMKKFLN